MVHLPYTPLSSLYVARDHPGALRPGLVGPGRSMCVDPAEGGCSSTGRWCGGQARGLGAGRKWRPRSGCGLGLSEVTAQGPGRVA